MRRKTGAHAQAQAKSKHNHLRNDTDQSPVESGNVGGHSRDTATDLMLDMQPGALAKCGPLDLPTKCMCAQDHATQMQCYHWPCPCAAEARAYTEAHGDEIRAEWAKKRASAENPLCTACQERLAHPGHSLCEGCIKNSRADAAIKHVARETQRASKIEVE